MVGGERGRSLTEHPPSPQPRCFQEARKAQLENHEPEEEEEEELETEEKEAGGSGKAGQAGPQDPGRVGSRELGLTSFPAPSQMRSERRAAAVRRKAARTSARAVRANGKRVTETRQVTRVAAARMRAARMRPGPLGTKRRSLAATRIRKTMRILMMRTEARPVAVTMIRTAAVTGVASGAAAAAPVPSPVAASTQPRRMAVKQQLLIPAKLTVTVTESQGLQGRRRHDYDATVMRRKALFFGSICEPFALSVPLLQALLLIKPVLPSSPPPPCPAPWSRSAYTSPPPLPTPELRGLSSRPLGFPENVA